MVLKESSKEYFNFAYNKKYSSWCLYDSISRWNNKRHVKETNMTDSEKNKRIKWFIKIINYFRRCSARQVPTVVTIKIHDCIEFAVTFHFLKRIFIVFNVGWKKTSGNVAPWRTLLCSLTVFEPTPFKRAKCNAMPLTPRHPPSQFCSCKNHFFLVHMTS